MTNRRSKGYYSYLLRLWCESNDQHPVWRASLHCVQTSNWYSFPSLQELFVFLHNRTDLEHESSEEAGMQ